MSSSASILSGTTIAPTIASTDASTFAFPPHYSFPPFFTLQPNPLTRSSQLASWASYILSYCRHHRIYQLSPAELVGSSHELFFNKSINRRLALPDIRTVLEYMTSSEGGKRAEWLDAKTRGRVWIWWRTPDEWADVVYAWVDNTGQKGSVLTVYEISQGSGSKNSDLYDLDGEVVNKALNVLVKRGKAQVFGEGESKGVKFF